MSCCLIVFSCVTILNSTELSGWKCGYVWNMQTQNLTSFHSNWLEISSKEFNEIPKLFLKTLSLLSLFRLSRLFFKYWHQEELARLLERMGRAAVVIQKSELQSHMFAFALITLGV